nr:MAG TPA: hypothetical protein [Caudoviricetes sp.]
MHTFELIEINCGIAHVLYTATSRQDLYRAYRAACQRGGLVRMRIDGKIMPIHRYQPPRPVQGIPCSMPARRACPYADRRQDNADISGGCTCTR